MLTELKANVEDPLFGGGENDIYQLRKGKRRKDLFRFQVSQSARQQWRKAKQNLVFLCCVREVHMHDGFLSICAYRSNSFTDMLPKKSLPMDHSSGILPC